MVRNMCCRCRSLHIQFSTMFAIVAFFFFFVCLQDFVQPTSTAKEHAITTACEMISIFSVSHPSSCRVGKCQEVEGFSLSVPVEGFFAFFVHRKSVSCCVFVVYRM